VIVSNAKTMLIFCCLSAPQAWAVSAPDILIADFEQADFQGWTVKGDAFGQGPITVQESDRQAWGIQGQGIASSYVGSDGKQGDTFKGTLTSPAFLIERDYITFLIGGGKREKRGPCVKLLLEGKIKRVATAFNSQKMRPWLWDVRNLKGQRVQIQLLDSADKHRPAHWGFIAADHFVQTDAPAIETDPIKRAMQAVAAAVPLAEQDPQRPVYHFRPPAQWMNDINGSMYYKGYYHIFYQHNPYAETWECMHWGHARSKDLVYWEHQPIALWPSYELGEEHVFSGGGAINGDGKPMLFYTSIKQDDNYRSEWAAISHDDMKTWEKLEKKPIVAHIKDGNPFSAQDPFVFTHDGHTWLISSSLTGKNRIGGQHLYRARSNQLDDWEYKGRLFDKTSFCPNLVPVGNKWVFFLGFDHYVGRMDWEAYRFHSEKTGPIVYTGNNALSSNLITNGPEKREIFTCWITRRKHYDIAGRGWAGCMSLPQELFITEQGTLGRRPVKELAKLREKQTTVPACTVSGSQVLDGVAGHTMELMLEFKPSATGSSGIRVRRSADGCSAVSLRYQHGTLLVDGHGENPVKVPVALRADGSIKLQIFLDRAILEYYINDGQAYGVSFMHNSLDHNRIEFFSDTDTMQVETFSAWELKSIW